MRLTSQNSQFVFSFTRDFIGEKTKKLWNFYFNKIHSQYDDPLDYLNSTIKDITFPGFTVEAPVQTQMKGKTMRYKSSKNIHDNFNQSLTVTLRSVDSHMNYFLLLNTILDDYMDTNNLFTPPFMLAILDWHRDAVFYIFFDKIILTGLSELTFSYGDVLVEEKTFQMNFAFNFIEMEFVPVRIPLLRGFNVAPELARDEEFNRDRQAYINTLRTNSIERNYGAQTRFQNSDYIPPNAPQI